MPDVIDQLRRYATEVELQVGRTELHQVIGRSRGRAPGRGGRVAVALCAAAVACVATVLVVVGQSDGPTDLTTSQPKTDKPTDTARRTDGSVEGVAGDVGPGGGVVYGGREMQSTPAELHASQSEGETVVYDAADAEGYYVTAQRVGDLLCIRLRAAGQPAELAAEDCEVPAYALPKDVTEKTFLSRGTVQTTDGAVTLVFGVTYGDVAAVAAADGSATASLNVGMPFWMHSFFALPAPAGAGELIFLDNEGTEVGRAVVPTA